MRPLPGLDRQGRLQELLREAAQQGWALSRAEIDASIHSELISDPLENSLMNQLALDALVEQREVMAAQDDVDATIYYWVE